jgi:hypothetical protein
MLGGFGGSAGGHLISLSALMGEGGLPDDPDPVNRESTDLQAVAVVAPPTDSLRPDAAGGGAIGAFMRMRPPVPNAPETSMPVRRYKEASPRIFGLQSNSIRSGILAAWVNPKTMSQRRTIAPADTGASPTRFQCAGPAVVPTVPGAEQGDRPRYDTVSEWDRKQQGDRSQSKGCPAWNAA